MFSAASAALVGPVEVTRFAGVASARVERPIGIRDRRRRGASAVVRVQTNVLNETASTQQVTLTTQIVDASGAVVAAAPPVTQAVPAMTPSTFPATPPSTTTTTLRW